MNTSRRDDLFLDALERPEDQWTSFVTEQAGADAALRDDVLSLLAAHKRAKSGFLQPVKVVPDLRSLSPGARLGSYRIERELGRGGMGVVYLAEDVRLNRKVALKAISPAYSHDEKRRERLRKEAQAAARLSHAGIATVFALEEIDGELFMACEYVPGRTLRDELQDGEVRVERVTHVAVQLARALESAHANGVVHRDLKPENVACAADGTVKVLDFGVARLAPLEEQSAARLTEAGTMVGTLAYMSPEQIDGKDVDARSDIFSFGVLLYEMATGVHPFEGESVASTIGRIVAVEPPPPRDVRPVLPADFDRIVARCLQKRREDRFQSTSELSAQLEQLIGARRPPSIPPSPAPARRLSSPAVRWWRVHQAAVVFLYAVMSPFAWLVTKQVGRDWTVAVFFAYVAAGALNGTLRVHLRFTERHNFDAFRGELRRAAPWMRGSDVLAGIGLVVLALAVARSMTPLAVALAAVGAGAIIVSLAIEPATTDAAFPKRQSGVRRRTPLP